MLTVVVVALLVSAAVILLAVFAVGVVVTITGAIVAKRARDKRRRMAAHPANRYWPHL